MAFIEKDFQIEKLNEIARGGDKKFTALDIVLPRIC
jgi:hypothetical protein